MGEQRLLESTQDRTQCGCVTLCGSTESISRNVYRECIYLCAQRGLLVYPIDRNGDSVWDNETGCDPTQEYIGQEVRRTSCLN